MIYKKSNIYIYIYIYCQVKSYLPRISDLVQNRKSYEMTIS